jgi:hypothetical protein
MPSRSIRPHVVGPGLSTYCGSGSIYARLNRPRGIIEARAHRLATRDPREDRGVGAPAPPAGGREAPRQKAQRSRRRAPGGGAQGQSAADQPPHRRPQGIPGVVQQEERAVQGRMGRTAALRSGSQDELPRKTRRRSSQKPNKAKFRNGVFQKYASGMMVTPGSTRLNVTFAGA